MADPGEGVRAITTPVTTKKVQLFLITIFIIKIAIVLVLVVFSIR